MKKLRLVSTFIIIFCILLCFCTACSKQLLSTPVEISINDEYNLSWSPIKDSRSYRIKITFLDGEEKEFSSRRAVYSLANFEEGDYKINIKAISGDNNYGDSEWSETFDFHKDYESGCLYKLINYDTEYEVAKVGTAYGYVELGDYYRGKPVTSIADSAFKGSSRVEQIVIGKNVTSIGENAFYNCTKLTEITIPETVTSIGSGAFHNCNKLEFIKLPSGLTEISKSMLETCSSLKSIELPEVNIISDLAFAGCASLKEVAIPDSVGSIGELAFAKCPSLKTITIGAGVQTIGKDAFYKCEKLTDVIFAEDSSLTTLYDEAFALCLSLEQISIPDGVSDLGNKVFYGCESLSEVELPDSLMHVGLQAFNATQIYTDADASGNFAYAGNWLVAWTASAAEKKELDKLEPTTLKKGVVGIADAVFANSLLISVDLPETVRVIGKFAFAYSTELSRVYTFENDLTHESSLEVIDEGAFVACKKLNRLFLNEGLKAIKRYAFQYCENLVNNTTPGVSLIPSTVESIGTYAFNNTKLYEDTKGVVYAGDWVVGLNYGDDVLGLLTVLFGGVSLNGLEGLGVRGIADYAFYNSGLPKVTIPAANINTLRYIGRGAFYGCSSLTSITLGRSLEKIDDYAFYNCSSLYEVALPSRLKYIGRAAFYNCSRLEGVDLSETQVTTIESYAFYKCMNVKEIILGDSIEQISSRAFYKCISVKELTIPDTVTSIGEYAFYGCTGLKTLTLGNGITEIERSTFNGCSALETLTIPDNVVKIESYAFYKCMAVTSLDLGNGVKDIGDYAFANVSSLTRLNLPQSVENIGRYAFMRCSALTSVILNSEIDSIGLHAFYGCSALTIYTNAEEQPINWDNKFNSSFRPVIWGCKLSDDGTYVVSVTIGENTLANNIDLNAIGAPTRDGYVFMGWATTGDTTEAEFSSNDLVNLEIGSTVYAIWR